MFIFIFILGCSTDDEFHFDHQKVGTVEANKLGAQKDGTTKINKSFVCDFCNCTYPIILVQDSILTISNTFWEYPNQLGGFIDHYFKYNININ